MRTHHDNTEKEHKSKGDDQQPLEVYFHFFDEKRDSLHKKLYLCPRKQQTKKIMPEICRFFAGPRKVRAVRPNRLDTESGTAVWTLHSKG